VHVINRRQLWWRELALLFSPSLYVAFYEAKSFKPLRGLCLHGTSMSKSQQYRQMQAAGIGVIPWQKIARGESYSHETWGDIVIVKPDHGREGRGVFLSKPENINFETTCQDGKDRLIQKFVETGDNPTYYRALSLFGEILYLRRTTNSSSRIDADSDEGLPDPVANAAHGYAELVKDDEVIAFAKQMATKAFPNIPILGQDIIRDRETGQLYCLEVNPYGSTWHFSTPTGRALQQRDNIDYRTQFDAFTKAAQILIEKTRQLAS
ncbi:MAG: hypothetical protein ACREO2_05020, partial [Arenimonas sp.]